MQCEGLGMNTQNMRLALKIKAVRVQRIAANITFVIGVMENKKTLFLHAVLSVKFHHLNMRHSAFHTAKSRCGLPLPYVRSECVMYTNVVPGVPLSGHALSVHGTSHWAHS